MAPPAAPVALLCCAVVAAGTLTACGGQDPTPTMAVFADPALTEVVQELDTRYAQLHPGTHLRPTFAGSPEIARMLSGHQVHADIVITTDAQSITDMAAEGLTGTGTQVATDTMEIAVAPGNPLRVEAVAGLARPKVRLAVSAPNDAAGRYAKQVLAAAGVSVAPALTDIDVRTTLEEVRSGRADAALVYATDVRAAGVAAAGVMIPAAQNVQVRCEAAVAKASDHSKAAALFVAWMGTPEAQAIFGTHGFGRA